jgi:hypothetical protein
MLPLQSIGEDLVEGGAHAGEFHLAHHLNDLMGSRPSSWSRLMLIRIFEELGALGMRAAATRFVDTPRGGVPSAAPPRQKPMYR